MSKSIRWWERLRVWALPIGAVVATVFVAAISLTDLSVRLGLTQPPSVADTEDDGHAGHDHSGHDHEGHDEANSLELSTQARKNLKLRVAPAKVGTFTKYVDVPAVVADWPGRTHIAATSPLTGVINAIYVSRGELIKSGAPMFTLRLTHQDLVNAQENFLAILGELDVEEREIARLSKIANTGAVAGKTLLNRQYERDKRAAALRAARQSLLLHGLAEDQISKIEQDRVLIREVIVRAPSLHADRSLHHESLMEPRASVIDGRDPRFASMQPVPAHPEHLDLELLVTELNVIPGESVVTGQRLATLSDYSQVLIEGHAFQKDGDALKQASDLNLPLQAVIETSSEQPLVIDGLQISYIGNEVRRSSRALPFYVLLPNQVERNEQQGEHRFVSWRYKLGQRMQLRVPIASLADAIVLPKEAIAEEGPESYVFVENGDHFDRVSVSIVARDAMNVAIANDGQVWPGQSVAMNRAHQLLMVIKNKSGGAIDPHAGHNH